MEDLDWITSLNNSVSDAVKGLDKLFSNSLDGWVDMVDQTATLELSIDGLTTDFDSLGMVQEQAFDLKQLEAYNADILDLKENVGGLEDADVSSGITDFLQGGISGDIMDFPAQIQSWGNIAKTAFDGVKNAAKEGFSAEGIMGFVNQIQGVPEQVKTWGNLAVGAFDTFKNAAKNGVSAEGVLGFVSQADDAFSFLGDSQKNLLGDISGIAGQVKNVSIGNIAQALSSKLGGEGGGAFLQNMVGAVGEFGGQLTQVIENTNFQDVPVIGGMLENAKGAIGEIKQGFDSAFGDASPYISMVTEMAGGYDGMAKMASEGIMKLIPGIGSLTTSQLGLNVATNAFPVFLIITGIVALIALITAIIMKYDEWGASIAFLMGPLGMVINLIMSFKRHWDSIVEAFKGGGIIAGLKRIGLVILDAILMPVQQMLGGIGSFLGLDFATDMADNIESVREKLELTEGDKAAEDGNEKNESQESASTEKSSGAVTAAQADQTTASKTELSSFTSNPNPTPTTGAAATSDATAAGSGGAKQINVRIENLVKEFVISTSNVQQGSAELKEEITKALVAGVRDFEMAV